jgi:hypothetical protein
MPRVGFERTIPALERAKTVRALDRVATVIGSFVLGHTTCIILFISMTFDAKYSPRRDCN